MQSFQPAGEEALQMTNLYRVLFYSNQTRLAEFDLFKINEIHSLFRGIFMICAPTLISYSWFHISYSYLRLQNYFLYVKNIFLWSGDLLKYFEIFRSDITYFIGRGVLNAIPANKATCVSSCEGKGVTMTLGGSA